MNIQEIKEQLFYYTDEDRVAEYEPMDLHTSFRCGGAADLFVTPGSLGELMNVLDLVRTKNIPYLVLGNGSNVLFKDGGYHGVVIRIGEKEYRTIPVSDWIENDDSISWVKD